nr:uncharacterized protein LOC111427570 isoform X1 [Onthophagus taurus]
MAFRLGHQISRNLNKNLIFQNSSASNARRYRSLSRGNDCEVEKVEDALPTGTETTQRKCLRARSHTKFSTPIASTRRELSTSSSSESPQQSAHEVEPIPSTMSSLKNNRKQSGNYSLQPKHLPPMATSSIHFDKQFIPAVQQQYDNRLDEVQRQASVKYEQAIKTFNVISSRTAAAQPKNVGYRYELDAAKPKVEKGTHPYNIIAAIKSREQSIAAQVPQLQPKNMKPYGDVLGKQWCTPLAERIKHKPLSMSHLNDAIIRSPYQHSPSIDAVPTSEHVAFSESNQRSSVEYAPGGTQFTSQPINSSQYPAFSRSGISSSKQIEQCTRKTYSTIQKANMSGYCSDSEPTLLLPGKVGNTDIDTKNTNESTSLQLYRATEKPVENNIAPKKREMISTLMEEKRNFTSQKYNLKNNESLKNVMSKNQPSMGSALLERIKKISKENLFAVRNAMNSSINANEVLDNTPPQNDKQIRETEPIKVTVGPRLKLQSTVSWTLEEYSEREKSLIPQSGEKFTVPWLSWGDRVKMQKEEEGKNANTVNLNLIPKSIASSAVKDKSRSVNERQTRRFSTFRFLEKEVEMEKILAHPVHKDFIIGIDLPENKHLLTKNTIPYVNVRSYGTGYGSGTSTGLPDDCLCDPPPRKIPPESVAYCHIEKFPKTHVNPDCKKKCQSEYTVMVKLRRLPKIHIPDPCRDCPEPCDDAVRADGCIKVPRKCLPKLIPKPCPPIPPPCMTDVPLRRLQPRPVIPFRPCPPPPCIDPRADDGLKPVRKTLPKLVPKMCGRCEEIIMTSPPLVRLIPRDVYPPPPCKPPMCPEPPITRADEGMRVCPKQLPKLIAPTCPRICPEELVDSPPLKRLKCACVYTERICPCVPTYRNPCCPPPSRSDDLCGYKVPKKHLPTMLLPERYNEVSTSEFNRMKSRHYCTHSKDTMCCCANKKIRLVVEDFKNSQFGEEKKLATVECERQEQPDNSQNATVQLIRKPIGDVKRSTIIPIHLLKEGYTANVEHPEATTRPHAASGKDFASRNISLLIPIDCQVPPHPFIDNSPPIKADSSLDVTKSILSMRKPSLVSIAPDSPRRQFSTMLPNFIFLKNIIKPDYDKKYIERCEAEKKLCKPRPPNPCGKQKTPYPSFSECKDDDPYKSIVEIAPDIKHLQPKNPVIGKFCVITPPIQRRIDPRIEEDCVIRKLNLKIDNYGTTTCDDFGKPYVSLRAKNLIPAAMKQATIEHCEACNKGPRVSRGKGCPVIDSSSCVPDELHCRLMARTPSMSCGCVEPEHIPCGEGNLVCKGTIKDCTPIPKKPPPRPCKAYCPNPSPPTLTACKKKWMCKDPPPDENKGTYRRMGTSARVNRTLKRGINRTAGEQIRSVTMCGGFGGRQRKDSDDDIKKRRCCKKPKKGCGKPTIKETKPCGSSGKCQKIKVPCPEEKPCQKSTKPPCAQPKSACEKPKSACEKPKSTCGKPKSSCPQPKKTCAKPKKTCAKPKKTCAKPKKTCAAKPPCPSPKKTCSSKPPCRQPKKTCSSNKVQAIKCKGGSCKKVAKPPCQPKPKCDPKPAPVVSPSCPKKGLWEKIVQYFRARPCCPAPDQWKKDKLKRDAEIAAAAAGFDLCPKKFVCAKKEEKKPCGKKPCPFPSPPKGGCGAKASPCAKKKSCAPPKPPCPPPKPPCPPPKPSCGPPKKTCSAPKKTCGAPKKTCGAPKKSCDAPKKSCGKKAVKCGSCSYSKGSIVKMESCRKSSSAANYLIFDSGEDIRKDLLIKKWTKSCNTRQSFSTPSDSYNKLFLPQSVYKSPKLKYCTTPVKIPHKSFKEHYEQSCVFPTYKGLNLTCIHKTKRDRKNIQPYSTYSRENMLKIVIASPATCGKLNIQQCKAQKSPSFVPKRGYRMIASNKGWQNVFSSHLTPKKLTGKSNILNKRIKTVELQESNEIRNRENEILSNGCNDCTAVATPSGISSMQKIYESIRGFFCLTQNSTPAFAINNLLGRYNGLPNESKTFGSAESRPSALSQRTSKDLSAITPEYLGPFSRPNKPNIHYRTYATQSLRVYTTGSSSIFKKIKENRKRCAPVRYHNDDSDSKECPKFGKCSIKKPPCCGPNPRGFDCSIKAPYPPCTAQQAPYPSFSECQKECCKRPRNECTEQDRIFERQKQTGQLDICNILKTPPRDFRHGAPKKDDPGCKGAASCKEYSTLALAHQAKIFNNILPPPTKTDSSVKRNNSSQLTKVSSSTKATLVGSNDHKLQRIAYSVFSSDLQKLSDKEFKNFFLSASFLAPPKTYSETNCDDTTSYLADAVRRYCSTLTLPQLVNITKKSCGNNASIRFSDSILGHKNIRSYSTLSQTRMYSTDNNCAKEPCKIDPEGCCLPKARESCNIKAPYPPCASIEAPYPSFSDCNKGFPRLPICECSEQEKVFIKMKNSGMFDMSPKKRNNNNNCGLKLRKCEPPHKIPCDREFSTCVDKFFADPNDEIEFDTESCLSKEETEKTDYKPEIVPRICDVSMTGKSIFPRCFQHSGILSSSSQANLCQVSYRHFSSNKNPKYNKYALKRDDVETCDSSSRHPCSPVSTPYSCYSDHQKELTKPINQSAERDRIFERLRSNGAYDMKNLQKAKKHATFTNPKIKFDTNAQRRMFSSYSKNWGHSQPSFFNETTDDAIRDLEGEELAKKVLTTVEDGMDAIALSANEVEAQEAYYQMYENLVKLCQQEEVSKKTPSISNIKSNNIEPIFSRDVFFDKCLNNNAAQKQMTSDAIKNIFTSPFPNPTTSTTIYEETEKNKTESLQKELDKLLDHYKTQKM